MKKIIGIVYLILMSATGFSQTEKGSWMLGGSIQYSSLSTTEGAEKSTLSLFSVMPKIGYFPVSHLAIILNTDYETYSGGDYSDHTLLIGPAARYYFNAAEKTKFFLGFGVGFGSGDGTTGTAYQFEAGPSFFITPAVALELNIGYDIMNSTYHSPYGGDYSSKQSRFGIGLGFMIYLGKHGVK